MLTISEREYVIPKEDERAYEWNKNLIYSYLDVFLGKTKTPKVCFGEDIGKTTTFLLRFLMQYVMGWTREEAQENRDEFFRAFKLGHVVKKGFIEIPMLEDKSYKLVEFEDVIDYVYAKTPADKLELLAKIARERNLKNKRRAMIEDSLRYARKFMR